MIIYFNNSGLDELACPRRYLYRVIKGARTLKSPELSIGKIFHAFMRDVKPGESIFDLLTLRAPPEGSKDLSPTTLHTLADLACQLAAQPNVFHPIHYRELFFSFDNTEAVRSLSPYPFPAELTLNYCGTTDVLSYDPEEDCAVVTDYKTTKKDMNAEFYTSYSLKSQPFFYILALIKAAALGLLPNVDKAILLALMRRRVKFRYIFVNYVRQSYDVRIPQYLNDATLEAMEKSFEEKAALAAFLHCNPTFQVASKDGMFSNHCYFCAFKRVCALQDPQAEEDAMEKWPLGFATYNPQNYDV